MRGSYDHQALQSLVGDKHEKMKLPDARILEQNPGTEQIRAPSLSDLSSFDKTLKTMAHMTTGARSLGEAADVITEMFQECDRVALTMSGVASVGKLDYILAELVDRGFINLVVATGAIITHGCSYEMGGKFYHIEEPEVGENQDIALYNRGFSRVYDTLELEKSMEKTSELIEKLLNSCDEEFIGSHWLHRQLGLYFNEHFQKENGILHSAARAEIPVIVPAFTDSEIGLSFARYIIDRCKQGKDYVHYDGFEDVNCICNWAESGETLGILTLGGGVPRNWTQQIGPFFDELEADGVVKLPKPIRFKYGVRICPEFTEWGGLSGCTYSEGISWGKFVPKKEGGRFAEVYSDYTTVFPILIKAVMERLT